LKQETTFNIENETLSNQAQLNTQFEIKLYLSYVKTSSRIIHGLDSWWYVVTMHV